MSRALALVMLASAMPSLACAQANPNSSALQYGGNPAAGHTFNHDGVDLYFEIYGAGEPLLLVHGNGGSIADLGAQIAHFRASCWVSAATAC